MFQGACATRTTATYVPWTLPSLFMALIDTLERKFGRFALPRIITIIAGFQALNWFLVKFVPEFPAMLAFHPQSIMQGQVWRLFSYVLLPGSSSIIWLLCIGFMFMLNDGLEEVWGSFKLNLFVLGGIAAIAIGGMIFGFTTTGSVLWAGILFAFACHFPNQEILFYFIIPLKIKWLAYVSAALLMLTFFTVAPMRWEIFFSLLNFLVVFVPGFVRDFRHRSEVGARRRRFEQAQPAENESLHRCSKCGRTDTLHPQLEFRVNAEGEDICSECRVQKQA